MRTILFILIAALSAESVQACGRCGLFGRRCRFRQQVVEVVQPVAAVQSYQPPQQTITIQNNYNGTPLTSPLAAQGNTVYGYSTAALAYSVDPNQILNTAARLTENAQKLAETGFAGYNQTAQLAITNNADVQKILAATQHLKAAAAVSSSQSIKVELKAGQRPQVSLQPSIKKQVAYPKSFQTCLKCHSGAAPKGQFSLDGPTYTADTITKALRSIANGSMPPKDSGVELDVNAKGEIMQWLLNNEQK